MKRFVASLVGVFALNAALFAQQPAAPVMLTIRPADLPRPSLKYRLFPDRSQLTQGNAPTQYYRALSLFVENQSLLSELRADYWDNWLSMPLKELPRKEVEAKLRLARYLIRELEIGSKRKQCDWQLEGRSEGIGLIIPDVQGFRTVAKPIAMRARLAIADGNYAEACEMLQIGYALAHHMGQGPFFIQVLVGHAIGHIMTQQLETLMQQPDAPNLYWSLTVLPRPFIDLKAALQEDVALIENMLPWLAKLDATPISEAQVKVFQAKMEQIAQEFGLRKPTPADKISEALALTQATAEGKRELVAYYKFKPEQVAAMPAFQVAALYAFREYKEAIEEVGKWANVPEGWKYADYMTAQQRYATAIRRLDDLYFRRLLEGLGGKFQLERMMVTTAKLDRRIAALRCVEAIRHHATKHEGKLPATLAEVTDLPIPNDPLTNMPFEYAINGDKATLNLAKTGKEKKPMLTYYLTLQRGKE